MPKSKIEELDYQLKKIKEAYDTWQDSGLNKEILVIYIMHKAKMSKHDVKLMLEAQQKFFDELMKQEVVKRLEK